MGYQSSFPRALVYPLKAVGGIGNIPINVLITQRKIQFIYRQLRTQSELGKVLPINFQWAMIQIGKRALVFTTTNNISYIENAWVVQLHEELANMSGKLLLTDIKSRVLQRNNDEFLMDMFIRQYMNTSTLCQLNYCGMYLQVKRLSDIATNDGKRLQPRYYYGLQQNPYTNHR